MQDFANFGYTYTEIGHLKSGDFEKILEEKFGNSLEELKKEGRHLQVTSSRSRSMKTGRASCHQHHQHLHNPSWESYLLGWLPETLQGVSPAPSDLDFWAHPDACSLPRQGLQGGERQELKVKGDHLWRRSPYLYVSHFKLKLITYHSPAKPFSRKRRRRQHRALHQPANQPTRGRSSYCRVPKTKASVFKFWSAGSTLKE